MTNEELNTKLYERMFAEQEKYRSWLLTLPPEEVLNHAYEYVMREDILLSLEYHDLTDGQAKALTEMLSGNYTVVARFPPDGKDYNDYLCHLKGISKYQVQERSGTR